MSASKEESAYTALVRRLVDELGVKVAFVCEIVGAEREEARTLALSVDGEFLEEMRYRILGTPCARVYEKRVSYHARDVQKIYPEDHVLGEWAVDSYLGVAVLDREGEILGHVGVMNAGPIADPAQVETRLRRAAQEVGECMESGSRA